MQNALSLVGFAWNDAGVIHIGITEVMSAN